jgi:nitrite reductase (NADH) small subunit
MSGWTPICPYADLVPERGVAALVEGVPVAVFRTHDGELFALANEDPFTGAGVLARGIVGTRGPTPTLASPLHKQIYDLRTGQCLDDPGVRVTTYAVRCNGGMVEIGVST